MTVYRVLLDMLIALLAIWLFVVHFLLLVTLFSNFVLGQLQTLMSGRDENGCLCQVGMRMAGRDENGWFESHLLACLT